MKRKSFKELEAENKTKVDTVFGVANRAASIGIKIGIGITILAIVLWLIFSC